MKEVFIALDKKADFQFFIEILSDALRHADFSLSSRYGGLKIRFYGERDTVNTHVRIAKSIFKIFLQSTQADKDGYYLHDLKLLQMTSKKIISLDSISTVLNHNGFPSSVENRTLKTTATLSQVRGLIDSLYSIVQQIPIYARTAAMKNVLLTVCYTLNMVPEFVLEKGLESGVFKETKDKVLINQSPDKCIEEMLQKLSDAKIQSEYEELYSV